MIQYVHRIGHQKGQDMQDISQRAASYRQDGSSLRNGKIAGRMFIRKPSPFYQIMLLGFTERLPFRYNGQNHISIAWREPVPARLGGGRVAVSEPTCMTYRWRRNPPGEES